MHGFESFFVSEADGSSKTIVSRHATIVGSWNFGPHVVTTAELHGMRAAAQAALGQNLTGGFYSKTYDTFAGPDVIFAPNGVADAADDTVQLGSLAAWSRYKTEQLIVAVPIYAPLPVVP